MKIQFICRKCDSIFSANPVRKEYIDPMYGPCFKSIAKCPVCNEECGEYVKPKPQKAKQTANFPSCATGDCHSCPHKNQ